MDFIKNANWIKAGRFRKEAALTFSKSFRLEKEIEKATLQISALGVYYCNINSQRITEDRLTPGWTDYYKRIQFQTYDVTDFLKENNKIKVVAGQGWRFHKWYDEKNKEIKPNEPAIIAAVEIAFKDGTTEYIYSDSTWKVTENEIRYNNIYNGENIDFNFTPKAPAAVKEISYSKDLLIPQEGEKIRDMEIFRGARVITTPKGETVIDFSQEITGCIRFTAKGEKGQTIRIKHFEMLDKDGNVYTENYRSAKAELNIICDGDEHIVRPELTFYGFRYIQVEGMEITDPAEFEAIVIHSEMERTGTFECSDKTINQLFHNIIWGQKGNFLDVPTDCPQRDERFGWTGDAQVFCKVASYNFNVLEFFRKWLGDVRSQQRDTGSIPSFVPIKHDDTGGSAAWADVATIAPWQMYITYGDKTILEENISMMKRWVDYMVHSAKYKDVEHFKDKNKNPYLHNDQWHFGDWLALDLPDKEACGGATNHDLIGQAFFCYSTSLYIKACEVLGIECDEYKVLYENILRAFKEEYIREDGTLTSNTQTAYVLALHFNLTDKRDIAASQLSRLVREAGHLTTGFVGTPYLMHVLSDIGETELAYDLLFRKEFPSWCYPITMGATTMWERWNGQKPDGTFATAEMNSFNHYAYGAVGDWLYENAAGIKIKDGSCAFREIIFAPETDSRLDYLKAAINTANGKVASSWVRTGDKTEYCFTVPQNSKAEAVINGEKYTLTTGINKIVV